MKTIEDMLLQAEVSKMILEYAQDMSQNINQYTSSQVGAAADAVAIHIIDRVREGDETQ